MKGLKPAEFADDGAGLVTIDFGDGPGAAGTSEASEADRLREELDALKAQLAGRDAAFAEQQRAVRRTGNSTFLDGLIKDGRFLPVFRDGMLEFMDTLDSTAAVDFAEHGEAAKMTPADYFRRYLQHQPKVVEFAELAAGGGDEDAGGGPAAQAERIAAFVESERQQGRAVSYSDAARRIGAGNRRG